MRGGQEVPWWGSVRVFIYLELSGILFSRSLPCVAAQDPSLQSALYSGGERSEQG